jgi:nucleoside-diphosphate-sugar epimerase
MTFVYWESPRVALRCWRNRAGLRSCSDKVTGVPSAFLLGGAGQVGRAVARRLLEEGWEVTVGTRSGRSVEGAASVAVDRKHPGALASALGDGADLLLDCVCFDGEEAQQLLEVGDRVGGLVVLSSLSVYADVQGRSLDEALEPDDFPAFPVPVTEAQPTVPPGPATYSTRKAAMERRLLDQHATPVTVLRPGAIHGPHTVHAREWFFVKRALDARPVVVLAYRGESRFHPTGVDNLAQAVLAAAHRPGQGVFNLVDPDCPTVAEIGRSVGALLGHAPVEVLLPGPPVGMVGESPWATARPFLASTTRAEALLDYSPLRRYAEQLTDDVAWLVQATKSRNWQEVLPDLAENYTTDFFDYTSEDAYFRSLIKAVS